LLITSVKAATTAFVRALRRGGFTHINLDGELLVPDSPLRIRPNDALIFVLLIRGDCAPVRALFRNHRNACDVGHSELKNRSNRMDWNRLEGSWKQTRGKIREKWGKLTDDDLTQINGRRDQFEGKIQERYGVAKDRVRKDVDDWLNSLD
jgi:uncharacterized protein YjbJ (UPF0337 family)